ncbi:RluA family pseudouridine synthase [Vulcanococcus limneticus]|uniref:RluA family pseudouridine synthase n=1 Tax=Vulcanococcus limneticus TaxID=2170428 RepID=UPI00398C15F6
MAEPGPPPLWLPAAFNSGWTYRDRVRTADLEATAGDSPLWVSAFYAARYRHSGQGVWRERLAAGEIRRNGQQLRADGALAAGDGLAWHRPPWQEAAVPGAWSVVFDDGDLHVLDKPSGLPVLPAGGWLEHTLLRLLERRHGDDAAGIPRPVHRLGRFTSGLLVCARRPATRAWLSARLRESTAAHPEGAGPAAAQGCRKLYRALVVPGVLPLAPGASLPIAVPIGRRPHPQLGELWCAADGSESGDRAAHSTLTLLERGARADLVQVAIASGRPHQIRIHCAAIGAPLLGDPLYGPGGLARAEALPGDGGYRLQAWRLELEHPDGGRLELEVPEALGL